MGKKKVKRSGLEKLAKTGRHHIIPKSRGGTNYYKNISVVNSRDHEFYHALFENKKPDEIIDYLVTTFWKGNWDYVEEAYKKYNG